MKKHLLTIAATTVAASLLAACGEGGGVDQFDELNGTSTSTTPELSTEVRGLGSPYTGPINHVRVFQREFAKVMGINSQYGFTPETYDDSNNPGVGSRISRLWDTDPDQVERAFYHFARNRWYLKFWLGDTPVVGAGHDWPGAITPGQPQWMLVAISRVFVEQTEGTEYSYPSYVVNTNVLPSIGDARTRYSQAGQLAKYDQHFSYFFDHPDCANGSTVGIAQCRDLVSNDATAQQFFREAWEILVNNGQPAPFPWDAITVADWRLDFTQDPGEAPGQEWLGTIRIRIDVDETEIADAIEAAMWYTTVQCQGAVTGCFEVDLQRPLYHSAHHKAAGFYSTSMRTRGVFPRPEFVNNGGFVTVSVPKRYVETWVAAGAPEYEPYRNGQPPAIWHDNVAGGWGTSARPLTYYSYSPAQLAQYGQDYKNSEYGIQFVDYNPCPGQNDPEYCFEPYYALDTQTRLDMQRATNRITWAQYAGEGYAHPIDEAEIFNHWSHSGYMLAIRLDETIVEYP